MHVTENFKTNRLQAYRVPESLKPEVQRQIDEMLNLGIIKPSKSAMACPIVCVLKGKDGKDVVRLAIDYRHVNRYTLGDAFPGTDMENLIQKIGQSNWISALDEKEAYAAVWALKRFRNWIFGRSVTLFTDHNPITFLTESTPKSSKLMRWALAIQEYDVIFRYKPGKSNVAADCLSRQLPDDEPESPLG